MSAPEPKTVGVELLRDAIDRPRLWDQIDSSADVALTSVVAPAGWGKSLLLASWANRLDTPCAWLELTRADNDAGHLFRTLYNGLRTHLDSSTRRSSGRIDHLTAAAVPSRIDELAIGLRTCDGLIIVLDDVHILNDPTAIASLQRFVEAVPSGVRLITS